MRHRERRLDQQAVVSPDHLGNRLPGLPGQHLSEVNHGWSQRPGVVSTSPGRGFSRVVLAAALLVGALLCAPDSKSTPPGFPPRDQTLRPFDPVKADALSPERRREYDVRFFNEMSLHGHHPLEPRYQLFRRMADDGFEVAYLALRLYDIRHSDGTLRDPQAMKRLKALAAEGDLSAKCFYGRFAWRGDRQGFDWFETLPYIIDAAEAGHPSCTGALASFLRGDRTLPPQYERWARIQQDPHARMSKALELEEQAARAGDLGSQSWLALAYELGNHVPRDYGRARCWAAIATRTSGGAAFVAGKAIALEQNIRWAVARQNYDASSIKKYREGSWCAEVIAE
jgi:hypothetical protein